MSRSIARFFQITKQVAGLQGGRVAGSHPRELPGAGGRKVAEGRLDGRAILWMVGGQVRVLEVA